MKTTEDVRKIVSRVTFHKEFRVGGMGEGHFVQIQYWETDTITHEPALQRGRKWYISPHATDSEIVQTCLVAALASAEHQVREHFLYSGPCQKCLGAGDTALARVGGCPDCDGTRRGKPRAIYGPHFHADVLYGICGQRANYDARPDPE